MNHAISSQKNYVFLPRDSQPNIKDTVPEVRPMSKMLVQTRRLQFETDRQPLGLRSDILSNRTQKQPPDELFESQQQQDNSTTNSQFIQLNEGTNFADTNRRIRKAPSGRMKIPMSPLDPAAFRMERQQRRGITGGSIRRQIFEDSSREGGGRRANIDP